MGGSNARPLLLAAMVSLVGGAQVSAHRLDEYLQAARIGIEPDGVLIELDVTPGVAQAESFIAVVDRDRDGSLSAEEQRGYAGAVVDALEARVDGRPLRLALVSFRFPELASVRQGAGTMQLEVGANHPPVAAGAHELLFVNRHLDAHSVYLANALVPQSGQVSVTGQRRDPRQSVLTIDYAVTAESPDSASSWVLIGVAFTAMAMASVTSVRRYWPSL